MKPVKAYPSSVILCFFLLFGSSNIFAQHNEYYPDPNPAIQQKLEEWQDLKFGLLMTGALIHPIQRQKNTIYFSYRFSRKQSNHY